MVKNYIFDFGQVLIPFVPERMTAAFTNDKEAIAAITPVIFDRLYWDRLDDGTISDEEVKASACERLPEHYWELACKIYDNWYQVCGQIDGMEQLLRDLKENGAKLYLLSNISCDFAENWQKAPYLVELFGLFDGLIFSGPLHLAKPSKEIFEHLLCTHSLDPAECLFIDDNQKNLEGAAQLGISGYRFDGDANKLRAYLFG